MEVSARLRWVEGLRFDAQVEERKVELNSADEMGRAFTPMELFLIALGGCTGMDFQWILSKQRQKVSRLEVSVRGKRREEDPRSYEEIYLNYAVYGSEIRKDAIERAIRLSQEQYCSVKAMLKDSIKFNISYTVQNGTDRPEEFKLTPPVTS